MNERFQKVKLKTERWDSTRNRYFPNVFSRALAAKAYLISQLQHILSNATLDEKFLSHT